MASYASRPSRKSAWTRSTDFHQLDRVGGSISIVYVDVSIAESVYVPTYVSASVAVDISLTASFTVASTTSALWDFFNQYQICSFIIPEGILEQLDCSCLNDH